MGGGLWKTIKKWWFESGENQNKGGSSETNKLSFLQWMIILIGIGLAIMILYNYFDVNHSTAPSMFTEQTSDPPQEPSAETIGSKARESPNSMEEYEQYYENQLEDILGGVVGVGRVSVMVNLESTDEIVVEKNINTQHSNTIEEDREGGSRQVEDQTNEEEVVILNRGSDEEPIIVKTRKPQVRGVLVVANGADHLQVKTWIIEAVQRVLDVPAHKISVLPKKD